MPDGTIRIFYLTGSPEPDGFYRIDGGILGVPAWGRAVEGRICISPWKDVAERVIRSIAFRKERPAQTRLRLDLGGARRVAPALRSEAYRRTREASLASSSFLSKLHLVLKVPLPDCEGEARRILAAALACPAGGRFQGTVYPEGGGPFFQSDAFPASSTAAERVRRAEEFPHPLIDELKSLSISFSLSGRALHSELVLEE